MNVFISIDKCISQPYIIVELLSPKSVLHIVPHNIIQETSQKGGRKIVRSRVGEPGLGVEPWLVSLVEDRAMPCASTPTVVPRQGTMARDGYSTTRYTSLAGKK